MATTTKRPPAKRPAKKAATKPKAPARAMAPIGPPPRVEEAPWYDHDRPSEYLLHLTTELARVVPRGANIENFLAPMHREPLSEINRWRDEYPGKAHVNLVDWRWLDPSRIVDRQRESRTLVKPRIDLSATINKRGNLTARWYPAGYFQRRPRFTRGRDYTSNLLDDHDFPDPPDFRWFNGDEYGSWSERPSNELMFLRGGNHLNVGRDYAGWGPSDGSNAVCALLPYETSNISCVWR